MRKLVSTVRNARWLEKKIAEGGPIVSERIHLTRSVQLDKPLVMRDCIITSGPRVRRR